ncbi:hypothetical protein B0H10DRAFT_1966841 [Mycena sp. CBHHK59/15]|nr:hypothetical protein B0H10DRAFT_1966841 [Mycena sp. CBHHK59/15]
MSGSGPTHYSEELKNLLRLLKDLPETIPEGNTHNFIGYVPDPARPTKQWAKRGNAPPQTTITIECQAGLEALNAVEDNQDEDQSPHPPAQKELEVHRDGVDIRLPFFRDLLADTPVQGATAIQSLADWSSDGIAQDKSGGTSAGKAWDVEAEKIVF